MDVRLVRKLIETGVIRQKTEIEANYRAVDIGGVRSANVLGSFFIEQVRITKDGRTLFDVASTEDGRKQTVNCNDVETIDGMSVDRLIANYNLDDEGNSVPEPKRRGRKPGSTKKQEIIDDEDDDDLEASDG